MSPCHTDLENGCLSIYCSVPWVVCKLLPCSPQHIHPYLCFQFSSSRLRVIRVCHMNVVHVIFDKLHVLGMNNPFDAKPNKEVMRTWLWYSVKWNNLSISAPPGWLLRFGKKKILKTRLDHTGRQYYHDMDLASFCFLALKLAQLCGKPLSSAWCTK